jgi:hypothetical protein
MDADKQSFEFARDVVKQVMGLSSAIPALMITFSKDFVSNLPQEVKYIAFWSWGFFLASVLFGILALMALTGVLAERVKSNSTNGILKPNVRILSGIQIVLFFVGLALVVIFGWKAS